MLAYDMQISYMLVYLEIKALINIKYHAFQTVTFH